MEEDLKSITLEEVSRWFDGFIVSEDMLKSAKEELRREYNVYILINDLVKKYGKDILIVIIEQCLKMMKED